MKTLLISLLLILTACKAKKVSSPVIEAVNNKSQNVEDSNTSYLIISEESNSDENSLNLTQKRGFSTFFGKKLSLPLPKRFKKSGGKFIPLQKKRPDADKSEGADALPSPRSSKYENLLRTPVLEPVIQTMPNGRRVAYLPPNDFDTATIYRIMEKDDSIKILIDPRLQYNTKVFDGNFVVSPQRVVRPRPNVEYLEYTFSKRNAKQSRFQELAYDKKGKMDMAETARWTIYKADGEEVKMSNFDNEIERSGILGDLDPSRTLVLGNGGAGAAGLIKNLAADYNAANPQAPLTIIWRAGNSDQNFAKLGKDGSLDAAFTYEPHFEAASLKRGEIQPPIPVFKDQFTILAPPGKDPLGIGSLKDKSPENVTREIIKRSLILPDGEITYMSRYNFSAMGEKDEALFRSAVKDLSNDPEVVQLVRANNPNLSGPDLEVAIYNKWMTHVHTEKTFFPWDMIDYAKNGSRSKTYRDRIANGTIPPESKKAIEEAFEYGFYHLNDYGTMGSRQVARRDWEISDVSKNGNILENPAQLVLNSKLSQAIDTPIGQFIQFLRSSIGKKSIDEFKPKDATESPFSSRSVDSKEFESIYNQYINLLEKGENVQLETMWRTHLEAGVF